MSGSSATARPPRTSSVALLGGILAATMLGAPLHAQTWDLRTNWQDVSQPAPWSYRQGVAGLPWDAAWASNATGTQGAYALNPTMPSGCSGASAPFLPAWFRFTGTTALGALDLQAGDIAGHSVDGCNGVPANGLADIAWTSPFTGTVNVSGNTWAARALGRSSAVSLLLVRAGVVVNTFESATISFAGDGVAGTTATNRSMPFALGALNVAVQAGDLIVYQLAQGSSSPVGDFAGVNLTITRAATSSVPEPGTWTLLAAGLAGVGVVARRRART